jgi:methoxymalonate biosynthesis protein
MIVKCVIWDLDNTLLDGVYLESGPRPPAADPVMLTAAATLRDRGIIHAIASRNPPAAAQHAARVTGLDFAAAECGWGRKSDAVRQIAADLGIGPDAVAFVDDDLYERAEVSLAVPEALVLSPEDVADALGWPEFSPGRPVTAEGRRRGEMYAQRRRRLQEARAFAGSRDEFLRYSQAEVTIAPAAPADVPRLHELSVRTHQFNTAGQAVAEPELLALAGSAAHRVTTVRLRDRFGDDGLVGGCVVEPGPGGWTVTLLMMSCRAMGRGVIEALLAWLIRSAGRAGAAEVAIPCLVSARNMPLRLALAGSGFRAPDGGSPDQPAAVFSRPVSGPPPELPGWVTAPDA